MSEKMPSVLDTKVVDVEGEPMKVVGQTNAPEGKRLNMLEPMTQEEAELFSQTEKALNAIIEEKARALKESNPNIDVEKVRANLLKTYKIGAGVERMERQIHNAYTDRYKEGARGMRQNLEKLNKEFLEASTDDEKKAILNQIKKQEEELATQENGIRERK